MKPTTLFIALILIVTASLKASTAPAVTEVVIGLSPFLATERKRATADALMSYLLKTAPMGSRVEVWDAWELTLVVTVDVPVLQLVDVPQARAQNPKFAVGLGKLKRWFNSSTNSGQIRELDGHATLKVPEWLELISRRPVTGKRSILLLGSPLYMNLSEPSFSMEAGRYPADGHLKATVQDSVFGVAEKTNRLENSSIHWCYFGEQVWLNELHRTVLTRFWGLFVQEQKGRLVSFGADLPTTLADSIKTNSAACGHFLLDPECDKLEMRTATPRSIPLWMQSIQSQAPVTAPIAVPPQEPTVEIAKAPTSEPAIQPEVQAPSPASVTVETPPQPTVTPALELPRQTALPTPVPQINPLPIQVPAGKIGIGIAWASAGVDLDLYVRPAPGQRELYFRNTTSREGKYFHDYRDRNVGLDYEYVELAQSADPHSIKAWVNYYKGQVANVTGKVCVHYEGRTYVSPFTLPGRRGNLGGDSARRENSLCWIEIKLPQLLELEPNPNSTIAP